jgi:hypothetical protein
MNQIFSALENGFTEDQVIDFIKKKFPKYAKKFAEAQGYGFSSGQIINALLKKTGQREISSQGGTEYEQTRSQDIKSRQDREKLTGQLALLAGSSLAAPIAARAIQRAIPSSLQSLLPSSKTESILSNQLQQQIKYPDPSVTSQPPINPSNIPQPAQPQQPKVNFGEFLDKFKAKEKVDELIKLGNGPEIVGAYVKKFYPQLAKDMEKEAGDTIENVIGRYAEEKQAAPEESASVEPEGKKLDVSKEAGEVKLESKPIAKNETVASPQGVGEVKEIRGDKALVDINGKLHKVDVEDLEGEPEEVKNAKFDFDLADVPEDLRSAPLNEVYTPSDRRHVTVKYNAGLKPVRYLYYRKDGRPLSEDYVNKIKEGIQLPVSSGRSFWGVWNADKSDSRGAANYEELVANAQEEGTPDDPKKEYWFVKEEAIYEHPYMELKGKKELRELEKKFNEERKKRKKKAT